MKLIPLMAVACLLSRAAIIPSLSLEELVHHSEIIAHGRVTNSWSAWDSRHKYIWTHYSFELIEPILGIPRSALAISEPGGSLDGMNMQVSGAVSYAVGEEIIVFLYRTPIGYLRAVGGGQGKYTLVSGKFDGLAVSEFKSRVREAIRSRR